MCKKYKVTTSSREMIEEKHYKNKVVIKTQTHQP